MDKYFYTEKYVCFRKNLLYNKKQRGEPDNYIVDF